MNPADQIERTIKRLHITTRAQTDKRILDDAYVALGKGLERQQPGTRRMIVSSRITWLAAAAAVVLIALALLLSVPSKRVDTIEEFYRTLGAVENICASSFEAGQTDPFQQVWTSQTLKVRLFKTRPGNQEQFMLWDIPNKVEMIAYGSMVHTEALTGEKLAGFEKQVTPFFSIAPEPYERDTLASARWTRLDDPAVAAIVPGTEVYDLTYIQPAAPSRPEAYRKSRVFLDAKTKLPRRAELYTKSEPQDEYRLWCFVVVTYPSESEIQVLIRSTFGPPESRPGEPEYIVTPEGDRGRTGGRR